MIDDDALQTFNQNGFIPGPAEGEQAFLARVSELEHLPHIHDEPLTDADWKGARALTRRLFDFSVKWVPAFYSDRGLPFWQGAAVWISTNSHPVIQLKKAFRKGSYLGFYPREEVLAHEAAHAARLGFNEPRFEEILAYSTSKSPWRRWLGPLFRHSWESYFFVILLLLPLGVQVARLFYENSALLECLFYVPWAFALAMICRLSYHQRLLLRTLRHIAPLLKDPKQALAVSFRLTDQEITTFSALAAEDIRAYLEQRDSLRLRVVRSYFMKEV